jgi:transcriptional regulator with XRE-family HTH domain
LHRSGLSFAEAAGRARRRENRDWGSRAPPAVFALAKPQFLLHITDIVNDTSVTCQYERLNFFYIVYIVKNSLRIIREKKGVSLRRLGELLGIAHQTIANYEASQKPLNTEFLAKAAIALNVAETDITAVPDDRSRAFKVFSWAQLQRLMNEEFDTVKNLNAPKDTNRFQVLSDLAAELQARCDEAFAPPDNAPVAPAAAFVAEEFAHRGSPAGKGLQSAAEKLAQEPLVARGRSKRGA